MYRNTLAITYIYLNIAHIYHPSMKRTLLTLLPLALLVFNNCHSTTSNDAVQSQADNRSSNAEQIAPNEDLSTEVSAPESAQEVSDDQSGKVEYYNPNTGKTAEYDLEVEYDGGGDVERIDFPSGGYIAQHHITDQTHNGDGTITVTTDRGQEYTVDEEKGSRDEASEDE